MVVVAAWLRWFTPEGLVLPTGVERARSAEQDRARAEQELARAEQRSAELAAKVEAYERHFGRLPDRDQG